MLTSITKEQKAMMEVVRNKWIKLGLSTEPANHILAEEAIDMVYAAGGLPPPSRKIWVESPLAAGKLCQEMGYGHATFLYGNQEAFLSFYDYFRQIDESLRNVIAPLDGMCKLAESCGWAVCLDNCAILCERPLEINLDEEGRLHAISKPAIAYGDGFCLYRYHGAAYPKWIAVSPEKITFQTILQEDNLEVRRVMMETYPGGMKKLVADAQAVEIDHDTDHWGSRRLLKVAIPDDEDIVIVHVVNKEKSGRMSEYFLRVPPQTKTCKEAVEYTFPTQFGKFSPSAIG